MRVSHPLSVLAVATPPLLVLWFGGLKLRQLGDTLLDPRAPVAFDLVTPGGTVRVALDRYRIEPATGSLFVDGPRVAAPGGSQASARRLSVRNWDYRRLLRAPVDFSADGVRATLVRDPSGRLELQSLLPRTEGPATPTPYRVSLRDIRLTLVDLKGGGRRSVEATAPGVVVAGVGDDVRTVGSLRLAGAPLDVAFYRAGSRLSVDLATPGVALAPLVEIFRDVPELRKVLRDDRLGDLAGTARGTARFDVRPGRTEASGTLRARVARWRPLAEGPVVAGTITARLTRTGATGTVDARGEGLAAAGKFAARWDQPLQAAFSGRISAASVPPELRSRLPKGLTLSDGGFQGTVAYAGRRATAAGTARLSEFAYAGSRVRGVSGRVAVTQDAVAWSGLTASFGGVRLSSARGSARLRERTLVASVDGADLGVANLLEVAGLNFPASGTLDARALATGPWATPTVAVRIDGALNGRLGNRRLAGPVELAGETVGAKWRIERAVARTVDGLLVASGDVREARISGRGVRLGGLVTGLSGTAAVEGSVTNGRFIGVAEGYGLGYRGQTVPFARAELKADRDGIAVESLLAIQGSSSATGTGSYRFRDGRIAGQLSGTRLRLGETTDDLLIGGLDVPSLTLSGTLAQPNVTAEFATRRIIAGGVEATGLSGRATLVGDQVQARLTGALADGRFSAAGNYDLGGRTGRVRVRAEAVGLETATATIADVVALSGLATGTVDLRFGPRGVTGADIAATLEDVYANGTPVGSGPARLALRGETFGGSATVGSPERYLKIEDLAGGYDTRRGRVTFLQGKLLASRIALGDVARGVARYLPADRAKLREDLLASEGDLSAGISFAGTLDDPLLRVESLAADDLVYRGIQIGSLTASGNRTDRIWTVRNLLLEGPLAGLTITGRADERGPLALDVELRDVSLARIGALVPSAAGLTGTAALSATISGTARAPRARGTIDARGLLADEGKPETGLSTSTVFELSDAAKGGKGLALDGSFAYRGFQGTLTATAPLNYSDPARRDLPIRAALTLAPRPFAEVLTGFGVFDAERSGGTVEGRLSLVGPLAEARLDGEVTLKDGTLALSDVPGVGTVGARLTDLQARVSLAGADAVVTAEGRSSAGGAFRGRAESSLGGLGLLDDDGRTLLSRVLSKSLKGTFSLDDLRIRQDFAGGAYVDATTAGSLSVVGTLGRPKVEGKIDVTQLDTVVPTLVFGGGEAGPSPVVPTFDVTVRLVRPARVRASGLDAKLTGSGRIAGPTSALRAEADLTVEQGRLRLPGGVVRLAPGGDLAFRYRSEADTAVTVNLEGKTSLTTLDAARQPQRYDVTLAIEGNLLKEGDLSYKATSDPPGLSNDRVLSLLARTDLLSTVTSGARGTATETALRNALAGYALPLVLDPLTGSIARDLGLEYLAVEYDPFGNTSLGIGKTLGAGFSLSGRRQLSEPILGFPAPFEVRLSYRPRRLPGVFRDISFFVGADELRPWRFGVDYATTFPKLFGASKRPERTVIIAAPVKK